MKSFKITLLTIVAALLAWPVAAQTPIDIQSQHRTSIAYETEEQLLGPPELSALLTISRWESNRRDEMGDATVQIYEAEDQRWGYTYQNANIDDSQVTGTVTLVLRDANGNELDRLDDLEAKFDTTVTGFDLVVTIEQFDSAMNNQWDEANDFVRDPLEIDARILDQEVFLEVGKDVSADSANPTVKYQWDGETVREDQVFIAPEYN